MLTRVLDPNTHSCATCGGSLALEDDPTGLYRVCLMCNRSVCLEERSPASPTAGARAVHVNPVRGLAHILNRLTPGLRTA